MDSDMEYGEGLLDPLVREEEADEDGQDGASSGKAISTGKPAFTMRKRKTALLRHEDKEDDEDEEPVQEEEIMEVNAGELMLKSERVLSIFLHLMGRFPFTIQMSDEGIADVEFSWIRPQGIYFIITTVVIAFTAVMFLINLALMGFDIPDSMRNIIVPTNETSMDELQERVKYGIIKVVRTLETAVFHRGFLMFMIVGTSLANCLVCNIIVIIRRQEFANYFGFWTRSLHTAQLDVSPAILWNSGKAIIITVVIALFSVVGTFAKLATMVNWSVCISVLSFRLIFPAMLLPKNIENPLDPPMVMATNSSEAHHVHAQLRFPNDKYETPTQLKMFQLIGILLTFFILLWNKAYILFYYIKCKMMINIVGQWNGRVYGAVLRADSPKDEDARTTYRLLFKDHCVVLDLLEATNNLFEGIIESYFISHCISTVFEAFFLFFVLSAGHRLDIASQDHEDEEGNMVKGGKFFVRPYDLISVVVLLLLDQIFYFMILLTSSDVTEELMGGLEIARRTSIIGRQTDEELFFLLSLFNSFNRSEPTQIEGAGFTPINKELFVGFTVLVVLCLVVGLMFGPTFDWHKDRPIVGPFLVALEDLPDCHWKVDQDKWETCKFM